MAPFKLHQYKGRFNAMRWRRSSGGWAFGLTYMRETGNKMLRFQFFRWVFTLILVND